MSIKKNKILFVITKSNWGGAQRYVFDLATNLPKDTYEIAVAFGGSGILKTKLEESGIKTFEIKSFERDINIVKEIQSMREFKSIIEIFRPNVLHLNSSKAGGSGAFVGRLMKVPRIIFTAHGWPFYENRNMVWRALAWFFSYLTTILSHKVIVVSKHDYDKHMMPFCAHKLTHIHTAVPHIEFLERTDARAKLFSKEILELHRNNIWAVSTGELNQNKNLVRLLQSVKEFNSLGTQKIFLALMGDGDDRSMLEQFVKAHSLEEQVVFFGYVDDARAYLKAFDVFILPSLKEGLPFGLLEAGLASLCCIASSVGGIPDIIENEKNGVLIDPDEYHTIVSALQKLSKAPELRQKLGEDLKKKIEKEFSLSEMLEKTERVYR